MIIRLLRGRVTDRQEGPFLDRLRTIVRSGGPLPGSMTGSFGFRRDGEDLGFIGVSTWESLDAIAGVTDGAVDQPTREERTLVPELAIDLYEVAAETGPTMPASGAALGLIWGRVARNAEGIAHGMIRAVAPEVTAAGVTALHVGRRVREGETEVLVVATWRDRLALHAFARARSAGVLDAEFLRLLTDWRFETYDSLDAATLLVPRSGPAILLADDEGRYVDASPGVEALFGAPGELMLHRTVVELTPPDLRSDVAAAWQAFLADGEAAGRWTLLRPDGRSLPVAFRALANCPAPGIHASILTGVDDGHPGADPDPRPVAEIVAEAFPWPTPIPA